MEQLPNNSKSEFKSYSFSCLHYLAMYPSTLLKEYLEPKVKGRHLRKAVGNAVVCKDNKKGKHE